MYFTLFTWPFMSMSLYCATKVRTAGASSAIFAREGFSMGHGLSFSTYSANLPSFTDSKSTGWRVATSIIAHTERP